MIQNYHNLSFSPTLSIDRRVKELQSQGLSVLNLGIGEPDRAPHLKLQEALSNALSLNESAHYTPVQGILKLRQAISDWILREYGVSYDLSDLIITPGCKMAIVLAVMSAVSSRDRVLINAPYWTSYPEIVKLSGASVGKIYNQKNKYELPMAEDIKEAITPETGLIILNSPNNPTGQFYSTTQLKDIAACLRKFPHVKIITDDLYHPIAWDDKVPTLLQIAPDLKDRICLVHGLSKSHRITGWRIGFAAGPKNWIEMMSLIQSQMLTCAATPVQIAAITAYEPSDGIWEEDLKNDINTYKRRYEQLKSALEIIDGYKIYNSGAAFYLFADITQVLERLGYKDDNSYVHALLEEAHIACVPGSAFGMPRHIRFALTLADNLFEEAITRLIHFHRMPS